MNLKSMFIIRKSLFHWYWQLWPPIHNHHQHCLQKNILSIRNSIGKMLLISLILVQLISGKDFHSLFFSIFVFSRSKRRKEKIHIDSVNVFFFL